MHKYFLVAALLGGAAVNCFGQAFTSNLTGDRKSVV